MDGSRVTADASIDEIRVDDLLGDYPAVQYIPPDGLFPIDILVRLGSAFAYDNIESVPVVAAGVTVEVATPAMLYRMKRDTVRPQDRADAMRLRDRFDLAEEE